MTQPDRLDSEQFLRRKSFIELRARERSLALLDQGRIVTCSDRLTAWNRRGCPNRALSLKPTME
jgi:hypothetical protein